MPPLGSRQIESLQLTPQTRRHMTLLNTPFLNENNKAFRSGYKEAAGVQRLLSVRGRRLSGGDWNKAFSIKTPVRCGGTWGETARALKRSWIKPRDVIAFFNRFNNGAGPSVYCRGGCSLNSCQSWTIPPTHYMVCWLERGTRSARGGSMSSAPQKATGDPLCQWSLHCRLQLIPTV